VSPENVNVALTSVPIARISDGNWAYLSARIRIGPEHLWRRCKICQSRLFGCMAAYMLMNAAVGLSLGGAPRAPNLVSRGGRQPGSKEALLPSPMSNCCQRMGSM
jgi:hypothetical protein